VAAAGPDEAVSFRAADGAGEDWRAATEACLAGLLPAPAGANLGFVYVSDRFAADFGDVVERLRQATGVARWAGTVGIGVLAGSAEHYDAPAVVAMLAQFPEGRFVLFDSLRDDAERLAAARTGWLGRGRANFGVVHVDPRSVKGVRLLPELAEATGSFLVGALASSRANFPQVADRVTEGALSGVLIADEVAVATGVTQGCMPIGPAHTITAAQDNILIELDGRPALEVFREDIGELLARDLQKTVGYIFAAIPVVGADFQDYMVRNIVGVNERHGLVGIGERVSTGDTVMFCRRDNRAAVEDLRRLAERLKARCEGAPRGALYHSCLARGRNMFGRDGAELEVIRDVLGDVPLVGFFGNGEIAGSRLYTMTGVLTLFV